MCLLNLVTGINYIGCGRKKHLQHFLPCAELSEAVLASHGEHISAICPVASPGFYALKHQISVCVDIWLFAVPQEKWFCITFR